ncbi:cytochrome-c peroxidase [Hymenobacter lutimineralis]|uniref:Cytochrome-c peroxidase n=1 Tax=Hymenobacter lutimineralis TaxID=2606448 RepID=A0A5D6UZ51_9BACT|nr:cytochrome c peroxidase [Hymenobacter lutimineralis]TYZ07644.1 cytochrome-c peroxidase [Hymenobacter lutimineralis]
MGFSSFWRCWLVVAAVSALLSGCEPDPPSPTPFSATPYDLQIPGGLPAKPAIPADNLLTVEGVALGRMLFYEPRLSRNNTLSCGSCHQQSKAFTDGRARALGVDGQQHQRSTMSLANVLWEFSLNWDGAARSLEDQARLPLENPVEMHQTLGEGVRKLQQTDLYPPLFEKAFGSRLITEANLLKALAQFERTLLSANSRYDRYLRREADLTRDEQMGALLFRSHPGEVGGIFVRGAACHHCHLETTGLFSSPEFFNNGLDAAFADTGRGGITGQVADQGKFRAPSLRNIALTAPYMHDGRFQTLEAVVDHYNEHVERASPFLDPNLLLSNTPNGTKLDLTAKEKQQLIAFLRTLTDSAFIKDPRFSNPFQP